MRIRVEHDEVRLLENVTDRPRRAFRIRLEPPTRTIVGSEDCTGRGRIEGDRAVDLAAVSNEIRTGSKVRLAKWVHLLCWLRSWRSAAGVRPSEARRDDWQLQRRVGRPQGTVRRHG